jgi:hypothetical protein
MALLEEARVSVRRGNVFTPDQTRTYARAKYEAWLKQQDKVSTPA